MKEIMGNLIDLAEQGKFNVILNGANCFCNMGAGIAKEIKQRYPAAYTVDCATVKGNMRKLGTYSTAIVSSVVNPDHKFYILNCYTQFRYGHGACHADYAAIRRVFRAVAVNFPDAVIGIPLIGAGHAGGDWAIIEGIINEELKDVDITLVRFNNNR